MIKHIRSTSTFNLRNKHATIHFSVRLQSFFTTFAAHQKYWIDYLLKTIYAWTNVWFENFEYLRLFQNLCRWWMLFFYGRKETGTDCMIQYNSMFVVLKTKEFHIIVTLTKIQIVTLKSSVRLYYWLIKNIHM